MKRILTISVLMWAMPAHASVLEPIYSLKGLFNKSHSKPAVVSPEELKLRSDLEAMDGGINEPDKRLSLVSSSREVESFSCSINSNCEAATNMRLMQRRGGVSWNWSDDESIRIAPKAEVIHYQMNSLSRNRSEENFGYGVGVDSLFRLGGGLSAYASAGALQLNQQSGYEGLLGLSTQLNSAKLFVEARWMDMSGTRNNLDDNYEYSNVRIGISRAFSGL
ncbi:MAG: hypothetical protein U0998_02475 [Moraxellaceae bacterium]|nr:hypothetical protein [Moraxellaceae bacterium]MDZ4297889.1 hypothetical protein [Moraxellaceae bacterium]MDZ4386069.1 hypothetical protein [Moraxellaceae bacterium]